MKFAHIADVHLGGWRDPRLREANTQSFIKVVNTCLQEKVDFVIIAGDLFNTALPAMDSLKVCVQKLKELKNANIPVYFVAGSHDFSPSGKTMLDILEEAGLAVNVARGEITNNGKLKLKFVVDEKTRVKLTGLPGKKGQLEQHYYEDLLLEHLEKESGPKIFVFHTSITELKPQELALMESMSVSSLPKGFDYYAGGHVHVVKHERLKNHANIVYPGPVFPNNFSELEKLECGSMVLVENFKPKNVPIKTHPVIKISADVTNKTPEQAKELIKQQIPGDCNNAIVLLRVFGKLNGRPSDVGFAEIIDECYYKRAFVVLKNTSKLEMPEYEEIKVSSQSIEQLEKKLVQEHNSNLIPAEQEKQIAEQLMRVLSAEKGDAERTSDFEKRIIDDADEILK